jgi:transcription termination/antitermination protein NusG
MTSTGYSVHDCNEVVPTTGVSQPQGERRWFAVYTCAKHERRVEEQFAQRDIESFLPLYDSVRRWKDRRTRLKLPIFPGYVFVRIILADRLRVLQTPSVVRLVSFNGQPYPVPEHDIEVLRSGTANALRIQPHPYLTVGLRVRIVRGPLGGAQGILVRKKNIYRVVLSLDLIARSASVEVDSGDIERVNASHESHSGRSYGQVLGMRADTT